MKLKNVGIHLAYIVTFILGIGMCVFIIAAIKGQRDMIRVEYARREAAQIQCKTWADRLDGDVKEDGEYRKFNDTHTTSLPERDPWGRSIKVKYSSGGIKEILKVISAGPDGKEGTRDDVVEIRQSTRVRSLFHKKEIDKPPTP